MLFRFVLVLALVASVVQVVSIDAGPGRNRGRRPSVDPAAPTPRPRRLGPTEWDTKNQTRVWWNEDAGRWDAILPAATIANGGPATGASEWWVAKGVVPTSAGVPLTPVYDVMVDNVPDNRPDVFWNETTNRLHVLFSGSVTTVYYELQYTGGVYSLVQGPLMVPGMDSSDSRAVIFQTSNNVLWAAVMDGGGLYINRSTNGADWAGTPTKLLTPVDEGQVALTQCRQPHWAWLAAENGDAPPTRRSDAPPASSTTPSVRPTPPGTQPRRRQGTLTMATNPLTTGTPSPSTGSVLLVRHHPRCRHRSTILLGPPERGQYPDQPGGRHPRRGWRASTLPPR